MKTLEANRAIVDSLYRISSLLCRTDDPNIALESILDEIFNNLDAASASIALINPDTNRLEIEVCKGLPENSRGLQLRLGEGITGWVAMYRKPLLVNDVLSDPRYFTVKDTIRSEMAVPMEYQGGVIGVVNVDSEKAHAFDDDDLKLLTLLTNEATNVISRLWLVEQLKAKAEHLQGLINMAQNLGSKLELSKLLESITGEARNIMKCRLCAVFILSEDGKTLDLKSLSGAPKISGYQEKLKLEDSTVGTAILHRKQIEVHDLRKSEEHHFINIIQSENLVSLLCVPIIYEDDVIGVLNAYTDRPHRFSNEEKRIFSTMANLGAVAIENLRLYARVFAGEDTLRRNERLTTLGMLAAEIAHEIRNPLTVIKLLFESLDLDFKSGDVRKQDAAIIGEKLNQFEDIVSRILSFGKSTEGLHSHLRLSAIIEDTLHLVRLKLEQSKIDLTCETRDSPLVVDGSKGQLQQVILNLIFNAADAMPEGGSLRIISYRQESAQGPLAAVEISDSGPGIPKSIRENVFDSFLTGRNEGTGLGLAVVKRILKSHRGDIEVMDSSSAGTTMKLWLPLVDQPAPENRPSSPHRD